MMSRVSAVTASPIFASSTVNLPSGADHERALIEEVVQLDRDAAAVRFVDAEPDRPEREARNVVYIVCAIAVSTFP